MNTSFLGCNMRSTALSDVAVDKHRRYLAVIATTTVTATISSGTPFTIEAGAVWSPIPAPINDITFTGTGTLVLG